MLTTANPESGTISYSYDADGNLLYKTSPAPNASPGSTTTETVSYCYDSLNRVLAKGYALSPNPPQSCSAAPPYLPNPAATYTYDAGTNGIGHLTSLTDQAGSGSYSYDVMGRVAGESRTIAGISKGMSYQYNLDGSIRTLTYPSGAVIAYTADAAGRMLSAVDNANQINYVTGSGGPNSASGATYGPDGSILSFNQGWTPAFAGIANSFSYNSRLQPVNMAAVSPGSTGTNATASVTLSGSLNNAATTGGTIPLAAVGSALSSFVYSDGSSHAFYLGSNQHVCHLFWNSSGSWQDQDLDLTATTGNTLAANGSPLSSVFDSGGSTHVFYFDTNHHLNQLLCCPWQNQDLTAVTGAPAAATGSGLASQVLASGNPVHAYYLGPNQHVYHMFINATTGGWQNQDLTAMAGAPAAAAGSALSSVLDFSNVAHVFYLDGNQHINQLSCGPVQCWQNQDLTAITGNTLAAAGSALTGEVSSVGNPVHLYYFGPAQHLYHLFINAATGSWQNQDLTAATNGHVPAGGSALTNLLDGNGTTRVYFLDGQQHVNETACPPGSCWENTDMTSFLNTNAAGAGSGLTSLGMSAGNPVHVHYVGPNQHVYHMYIDSGGVWHNQDVSAMANLVIPDSGTVALNLGGFNATACFGPSSNSACNGQAENISATQLASALASALNVTASPVTASASGATINLTWKAIGTFTTAVSALSTSHDNPSLFPNPSFTSTATNFSGGSGANLLVLNLSYDFHLGAGDNGNVFAIANNKDTSRSQTFTYDPLNRLISAQNAGTDCTRKTLNPNQTEYWGNSYGYDAWGNLLQKTVTKCSAENMTLTALANNQLSGYGYDAAGNMTHDATANLNYSYDQENRITGAGGFTYTYDADGNRVEKSNGSTGTLYWYMTPGIVAESDLAGNLQSEYVFFGGERVARKDFPGNAVSYYFSDHLKSTDIVTDAQGNMKNEADYYPWGGELQFANNDSNHYKFTGKERDSESGLDYFGARHYSNGLGRFATPDPPNEGAEPTEPQSWSAYTYVANNPETNLDPDGRDYHIYGPDGKFQGDLSNWAFRTWCRQVQCSVSGGGTIRDAQGTILGREVYFDREQAEHLRNMTGFMNWFMVNHLTEMAGGALGNVFNILRFGSAPIRLGLQGKAGVIVVGQTVSKVIQTPAGAYTVKAIVASVEGDTIVLSDVTIFRVVPGAARPGVAALNGAVRALRAELANAGFSYARIIKTERVSGVLHTIEDWTISLK